VATLKGWRFKPATVDGIAISSRQDVHFHFPSWAVAAMPVPFRSCLTLPSVVPNCFSSEGSAYSRQARSG